MRGDGTVIEGWGTPTTGSGSGSWIAVAGVLLLLGLAGFLVHPILGVGVLGLLVAPAFVLAPHYALLLFVAVLPFDAVLSSDGGGMSITKLLGLALLGGWLLHVVFERRRVRVPWPAWWLAAYVAFGAVSIGWAADPDVALSAVITLTQLFFLAVMAANVLRDRRDVQRLLDVMLIATALLALLALAEMAPGARRVTFSFGGRALNPNYLAAILVCPAVAAIGLAPEGGRRGWWRVGLAAPIALVVVLSGSRGGGVALAGGLLVVGLLRRRIGLWLGAAGVGAALLAPIAAPSTVDHLYARYARAETDRLSGRMDIWRVALAMVEDKPLTGTAIGGFKDAFYHYMLTAPIDPYFARIHSRGNRAAHNIYLGTLAELGLVGFALLVLALLAHARALWRARARARRLGDEASARLAVGLLGVFVSLVLFGSTLDLLATKGPWIWLAAMQALAASVPAAALARRA